MNVAVTVRPATTAADLPPVLTLTSAGTGMAYSTSADSAPPWADGRELIWVDRRGAGGSDGTLDCELTPYTTVLRSGGAGPEELAAVTGCFAKAAAAPIAFDALLDLDNVAADLVRVRAALGIDQWVVSTVRSGFDVGVRLLGADPSGVVSMVAADPMFAGSGHNSDSFAASWKAFVADCATVPACANFGDLAGDLTTALARVKDGVPTTVVDPLSGKPFVIQDSSVIAAVGFGLQGPVALLPGVITGLLDPAGDDAFASLTLGLGDPTWTNNGAISLGLVCQDVGLIMPATGGKDSEFGGEGTGQVCAGVKGAPKVVTPLVAPTSDVPVLIGRGEYSVMSSTERLDALVKPLSAAQVVPIAHVGSASSAADCWQGIVSAFVAEPAATLDTACAATVPLPEFK
jgi:pimeloyl-ACP methyl ester carboxylesterase